ncbi:MAG: nuclear transport factor 2 family protein [Pseudomonadota bacterium]
MNDNKINKFISNINSVQHDNVKQILAETYTENILFIDPVKTISGLDGLTQYFEDLYLSVISCEFTLKSSMPNDQLHSLEWLMHLQHKRLSKNKTITLDGASFIKFENEKVCYHRDYYDLGALIYENIPLLGSVLTRVRHAL